MHGELDSLSHSSVAWAVKLVMPRSRWQTEPTRTLATARSLPSSAIRTTSPPKRPVERDHVPGAPKYAGLPADVEGAKLRLGRRRGCGPLSGSCRRRDASSRNRPSARISIDLAPSSTSRPAEIAVTGEPPSSRGGTSVRNELTGWLASSPRFRTFATTYRPKIHKKVRSASGAEALRDVRAELLAAHRLLADSRFTVAYEAHGSGRTGPDFSVTYRTTTAFDLEVTRLRTPPEPAVLAERIVAKLRQLPPSVPNVLFIASDQAASAVDVAGAVRLLRDRADARDDAFFARRGLDRGRGFSERILRLGAVISWCDEAGGDERAERWVNPSARIALPDPVGRACVACLREVDVKKS